MIRYIIKDLEFDMYLAPVGWVHHRTGAKQFKKKKIAWANTKSNCTVIKIKI